MPRTTFIVCTYNNREIIDHVLSSIRNQSDRDWEAICVDDASTDGTPELIAERYPFVRLIRRTQGMGPSINRNEAIEQSTGDYIACLDSDVELDKDWLARTAAYLESHPDTGIVGGKLLYAANPHIINSYGGQIGKLGLAWDGYDGHDESNFCQPIDALWICSAAMVVRRSVLDRVGLFDDTFFYGYEDSDIGWRVVLAGYRCVCLPDVRAYHRARTTIGGMGERITFHYHKNRFRSVLKNQGFGRLLWYLPVYLVYSLLDGIMRGPRRAKLRAWGWQWSHLYETLALRRSIQQSRRRSSQEMRKLFSRRYLPPTRLSQRQQFRVAGAIPLKGGDA
ncbi:glycosyltransferase family 2 protein [bacterium]|nr:glycosyltransferase family 2 protein [bacterium]